jgi:ParB family chromosome partitioning protein
MSDTITESAELLHVDPASLTIGTNVRVDTRPDAKEFAKSIRERGVLEVITAYRDDDGSLVVHRGQRRTVVATQVGTPTGTVAVRVVPKPDEADRIVDQLVENLHRADMHEAEVLDGVEQLSLIGVSAAQIAKRITIKRGTVDAALVVANSQTARAEMASEQLTLEEAAIFAEFDGNEEAIERLRTATRRGGSLAHAAQRLRDEAADRAEMLAEVDRLRAEGLPVLDPDDVPTTTWHLRLDRLRDAENNPVPEETWPTLEGAAVIVTVDWIYPDAEPNEEVSDDDAHEEEMEYAEPVRGFVPVWIVTDPAAAGLHHPNESRSTATDSGESEADREKARAERARVLRNNKAWRSAETVRREWLGRILARKTAPTGAEALICEAVVGCDYRLSKAMGQRHATLRTMLGESSDGYGVEACAKLAAEPATAKAATMRTLAAVLCAWEETSGVHTWRGPSEWDARIMNALIGWGYEPSDVERILIGVDSTADDVEEPATVEDIDTAQAA